VLKFDYFWNKLSRELLHEVLHVNKVLDADSESGKRFSRFPIVLEIKIPKVRKKITLFLFRRPLSREPQFRENG
jgi:hypothetical protein